MERLDMNEPIVEVIGLAHGEFVKNGVTVRTELGDSLPPIQGDRVQLQQVMLNLVINAIQAMSDVRDSKRELHVTTGLVESGESVRNAVRDTGPGPSAETSKVCFNDGMGVGLSICRSIIEDHRGRLWASRIESQGALFQFTIPATQPGYVGRSRPCENPKTLFIGANTSARSGQFAAAALSSHIIIRSVSLFGTNRRLEDVCSARTATTMRKTVLPGRGQNT